MRTEGNGRRRIPEFVENTALLDGRGRATPSRMQGLGMHHDLEGVRGFEEREREYPGRPGKRGLTCFPNKFTMLCKKCLTIAGNIGNYFTFFVGT